MISQSLHKFLSFRSNHKVQNGNHSTADSTTSDTNCSNKTCNELQQQQQTESATSQKQSVNLYFTYVDIDISGSVFERLTESHRAMSSLSPSDKNHAAKAGSTLYRPKTVSGLNDDNIFKEFEEKMRLKYSDRNLQSASRSSLRTASISNFKIPQDPTASKRSSQVSLNSPAAEVSRRSGSWRKSFRTFFSPTRSKSSQQISASSSTTNFDDCPFEIPVTTERAASMSRMNNQDAATTTNLIINKRKRIGSTRFFKSNTKRPTSVISSTVSATDETTTPSSEFVRGPTIRRSFKSLSSSYIGYAAKPTPLDVPLPNLHDLDLHETSNMSDECFEQIADDELNETLKCCDEMLDPTTAPSTIPQHLQQQGVLDPRYQPYFVSNNGYLDSHALRLMSSSTRQQQWRPNVSQQQQNSTSRLKSFKPDDDKEPTIGLHKTCLLHNQKNEAGREVNRFLKSRHAAPSFENQTYAKVASNSAFQNHTYRSEEHLTSRIQGRTNSCCVGCTESPNCGKRQPRQPAASHKRICLECSDVTNFTNPVYDSTNHNAALRGAINRNSALPPNAASHRAAAVPSRTFFFDSRTSHAAEHSKTSRIPSYVARHSQIKAHATFR